MKLENITAREMPHVYAIYDHLIKSQLHLLPLYFYKTEISKKGFVEIFRFLEQKGLKAKILQKNWETEDFTHKNNNFISFFQGVNESDFILCNVECDESGRVHVTTGYNQRESITPEQAVSQLKPIKIIFNARANNPEFKKFDNWLVRFKQESEDYKSRHFFTVDNALPNDICGQLIEYMSRNKKRSLVLNNAGLRVASEVRTSNEARLDDIDLLSITNKVSSNLLGNSDLYALEKPSLVTYNPGQQYKPHFDTTENLLCRRRRTVILYLNDDFVGGETEFTVLDIRVKPRMGKALIFDNIVSNKTTLFSMHAGLPVISGCKHLCNIWTN